MVATTAEAVPVQQWAVLDEDGVQQYRGGGERADLADARQSPLLFAHLSVLEY